MSADHTAAELGNVDEKDFVAAWLEEIESAGSEEKEWRKDAEEATRAYRGEGEAHFNIYHANIETIVPALYNSTPAPDVRRRFQDPDPVAKAVADLLERALSFSLDAYDFDAALRAAVRDMAIVDRGVVRVRYVPMFGPGGTLAYQEVTCEYVPWRSFRRGRARLWTDVPWVAFEHFLSREQIAPRVPPAMLAELPFTYTASAKEADEQPRDLPRFGRRTRVWEIWDKEARQVHFVSPDHARRRLWSSSDPLGLSGFFPVPRPLQAIETTDSLVPITPHSIYKALLDELEDVTRRIRRLVKQLRPRAGYAGVSKDIEQIAGADDGELVPLTSSEMFTSTGGAGLDKLIAWFPLEPVVSALQALIQHRELIKQAIYEVTKIADIMRGATNPNETLGAQQLKAQWGSLSVQQMQAEVGRFARDLFRMKAEVIGNKFSMDTLRLMTGLPIPDQPLRDAARARVAAGPAAPPAPGSLPAPAPPISAEDVQLAEQPSAQEVEALLRQDVVRRYRIDIESDSTVRGDLARNQQQMATFLTGTAQFMQAIGPAVREHAIPADTALEIYAAFARQFKLGKQAEDALDRLADTMRKAAEKPAPPDPAAIKAQAQAQLAAQTLQLREKEAQIKEHGMLLEHQLDAARTQGELARIGAETQTELLKARLAHPPAPPPQDAGRPQ